MKKVIYLMTILATMLFFMTGCENKGNDTSDAVVANQTEKMMNEANRQIGMPNIVNFQEKKIMKEIYELRDQENLVCYAYFFDRDKGCVGQFIGKCIGYGLPYSTQYSNPEKIVYAGGYQNGFGAIPQPEPNGLFMPEGLNATWLLLIDPKTNKARPVYIEPEIIVSPFQLPHESIEKLGISLN